MSLVRSAKISLAAAAAVAARLAAGPAGLQLCSCGQSAHTCAHLRAGHHVNNAVCDHMLQMSPI